MRHAVILAAAAALPAILFALLELAGCRTMAGAVFGAATRADHAALGAAYVASWLATTAISPPLLVAAALRAGSALVPRPGHSGISRPRRQCGALGPGQGRAKTG